MSSGLQEFLSEEYSSSLLSVVSFYESPTHGFAPAEVALLRFGVGSGIVDVQLWHVANQEKLTDPHLAEIVSNACKGHDSC